MLEVLQALILIFVVLVMVPALAHALELPGKLRLAKDDYLVVQPIYYPGFTIAGAFEPIAIISAIVLLVLTPREGREFWLTLVALIGLIGMHGVYWIFTHPVNNFWLQDEKLSTTGTTFFSAGSKKQGSENPTHSVDWTELRDRWEYSHVARAGLALASFVALVVLVSIG